MKHCLRYILAVLLSGFIACAHAADSDQIGSEVLSFTPAVGEVESDVNENRATFFHDTDHVGDRISYLAPGVGKLNFVISYLAPMQLPQKSNRLVGFQKTLGAFSLGAVYESDPQVNWLGEERRIALSAGYQISDYKILARYQNQQATLGEYSSAANAAALGVEHQLGRQAKMSLWYSQREFEQRTQVQQQLSFSVRYDF